MTKKYLIQQKLDSWTIGFQAIFDSNQDSTNMTLQSLTLHNFIDDLSSSTKIDNFKLVSGLESLQTEQDLIHFLNWKTNLTEQVAPERVEKGINYLSFEKFKDLVSNVGEVIIEEIVIDTNTGEEMKIELVNETPTTTTTTII